MHSNVAQTNVQFKRTPINADLPVECITLDELEEFIRTSRSRILPVRVAEYFRHYVLAPDNCERAYTLLLPFADDLRHRLSSIPAQKKKKLSKKQRDIEWSLGMLLCNIIGVLHRLKRFDSYKDLYEEIESLFDRAQDPLFTILASNIMCAYNLRVGAVKEALTYSDRALSVSKKFGLPRAQLLSLLNRSASFSFINDREKAKNAFKEAQSLLHQIPHQNDWLYAHFLMAETQQLVVAKKFKKAILNCEEILLITKEVNLFLYLDALHMLVKLYRNVHQEKKALQLAHEGLKKSQYARTHTLESRFWDITALLFQQMGEFEQGKEAAAQGLTLAHEFGDRFLILSATLRFGQLLVRCQQYEEAYSLLFQALTSNNAVKSNAYKETLIYIELGVICIAKHEFEKAEKFLDICLELAQHPNVSILLSKVHWHRGNLLSKIGKKQRALSELHKSLDHSNEVTSESQTHKLLAQLYEEEGNLVETINHLNEHYRLQKIIDEMELDDKLQSARVLFEVEFHKQQAEIDRMRRLQTEMELEKAILDLTERSELLQKVKLKIRTTIKEIKAEATPTVNSALQKILATINEVSVVNEQQLYHLHSIEEEFFHRLRETHQDLTPGDIKFCGLIRAGLTNNDITSILHIAPESIRQKRYRLKKKLNLYTEESLDSYLQQLC